MANILVINSSAAQRESVSRILVNSTVDLLLDANPGAVVVRRDLGAAPMPHLTSQNLAGVRGVPATEAERAARALSDELIAELRAADTIVIGAPMYNFSIPTCLRAWFDYVLRAGHVQLFRSGSPGVARRETGHRDRVARRALQRGPGAGNGLPGAVSASAPQVCRHYQRDVRARGEAGLGPAERKQAIGAARAQLRELVLNEYLPAA
jgi:NAD(P)H-dependent FMN reductase